MRTLACLPLLLGLVGSVLPASAEDVVLAPRYRPGDAYLLSLGTTTRSDTLSRGASGKSFREHVRLDYQATVTVLETDDAGRATRERHEGAQLTFQRPGESGSLFADGGATLEVRRDRRAALRVELDGRRAPRRIERIVGALLAAQFEYTLAPALLEPGRPVAVGESWALDPARLRQFLRDQGLRAIRFGAPATATLVREPLAGESGDGPSALAVEYAIPVDWFELREMPANTRAGRSDGALRGRIRLADGAGHRPVAHSATLALRMSGAIVGASASAARPWQLERVEIADQQTLMLEKPIATGF